MGRREIGKRRRRKGRKMGKGKGRREEGGKGGEGRGTEEVEVVASRKRIEALSVQLQLNPVLTLVCMRPF